MNWLTKLATTRYPKATNFWEVGTGPLTTCHFQELSRDPEYNVTFVDADQAALLAVKSSYPNAATRWGAIVKEATGTTSAILRSCPNPGQNYIKDVKSPVVLTRPEHKFEESRVPAFTFDKMDPGNIDILCLDIEGSEWYCLNKMKSRPSLVCVEMRRKNYQNPFTDTIEEWFLYNGYKLLKQSKPDDVWILNH